MPPPRVSMLYFAIINTLLLLCALAMIITGGLGALVPGGDALRTSLSEMQSNLPLDLASRLLQALEYAPLSFMIIGAVLAAISCTGCCSSFSSGSFLLHVYAFALGGLVCAETAVLAYGVADRRKVVSSASQLIFNIWDKQCVCMQTLPDASRCSESRSECFHPDILLPGNETRACEPCQDYLIATVCPPPIALATAEACAQRISEVLYDELKVCIAILALIAGMQSVCCLCALRIAKWFKSVEKAERDEEALLAEAYASRSNTADF